MTQENPKHVETKSHVSHLKTNTNRQVLSPRSCEISDFKHLESRFTLAEYLKHMEEYRRSGDQHPTYDHTDPLYFQKYASSMPPLEAYKIVPKGLEVGGNTKEKLQHRKVFFGWNDLTPFEVEQIAECRRLVSEKYSGEIPSRFMNDREILKFCQAQFFNPDKAAAQIVRSIQWELKHMIDVDFTSNCLQLLQNGCIYIHGRDKFMRPAVIINMDRIIKQIAINPELNEGENFTAAFLFLYNYMQKVMLLPGHIEQFITIFDLGQRGITELPRDSIVKFVRMASDNMIYVTGRNHYINMSWGLFYASKTFKILLDEEQLSKIMCTRDCIVEDLTTIFHPCQLEKKYGGQAESPANYWPPFVGSEFFPSGDKDCPKVMSDEEYEKAISENPDLQIHPEYLPPNHEGSRDFINPQNVGFTENIADATVPDVVLENEESADDDNSSAISV